jgi:hypothetical protein
MPDFIAIRDRDIQSHNLTPRQKEEQDFAISIIDAMIELDLFKIYTWFNFSLEVQQIPPGKLSWKKILEVHSLSEEMLIEGKFVDVKCQKNGRWLKINSKGRELIKSGSFQNYVKNKLSIAGPIAEETLHLPDVHVETTQANPKSNYMLYVGALAIVASLVLLKFVFRLI